MEIHGSRGQTNMTLQPFETIGWGSHGHILTPGIMQVPIALVPHPWMERHGVYKVVIFFFLLFDCMQRKASNSPNLSYLQEQREWNPMFMVRKSSWKAPHKWEHNLATRKCCCYCTGQRNAEFKDQVARCERLWKTCLLTNCQHVKNYARRMDSSCSSQCLTTQTQSCLLSRCSVNIFQSATTEQKKMYTASPLHAHARWKLQQQTRSSAWFPSPGARGTNLDRVGWKRFSQQ